MAKPSAVESWTAEDEAAMQALLARHNRVSTTMIGDARSGNMRDASKRRCDESESSFTHLDYEDFGSADVLEPPYVQE
jgi:hypothetical protein